MIELLKNNAIAQTNTQGLRQNSIATAVRNAVFTNLPIVDCREFYEETLNLFLKLGSDPYQDTEEFLLHQH